MPTLTLRFVMPGLWLLLSCVTKPGTLLTDTARLREEATACDSFVSFDARIDESRKRLDTAPGPELVPASAALSAARRRCAEAVVEHLFSIQEQQGRRGAAAELEAIARALGTDETTRMLRHRWKNEADTFLGDIALGNTPSRPTPAQPTPTVPDDKRPPPEVPETDFGEAANCLRQTDENAATCLRNWRQESRDDAQVATRRWAAKAAERLHSLPAYERASKAAALLKVIALPSDADAVMPLAEVLASSREPLLRQAKELSEKGNTMGAALSARPLLVLASSRARAFPYVQAAASRHSLLARELNALPHAQLLHRTVANWLVETTEGVPRLEAGRWDPPRWNCTLRQPSLANLMPGMSGRLVARCQVSAPTGPKGNEPEALRTFEMEASLPRVNFVATVTLTCAGAVTSRQLDATEVLLDAELDDDSSRPHPLEGRIESLVREAEDKCRQSLLTQVSCSQLQTSPLPSQDHFTRVARVTGQWEPCFVDWFRANAGTEPPPIAPLSRGSDQKPDSE